MKLIATPLLNAVAVPKLLLQELGIKVSGKSLKVKLEGHADFPSLMAVSDCFNEWSIPNLAIHIPKEKYNVGELQFPFIAQTPFEGGQFMLVHQIRDGSVTYSDEKLTRKRIAEDEFLKRWSGVLLYAEATEKSGEEGYLGKQLLGIGSVLKMPALILIISIFLLLKINFSAASLPYLWFLGLKIFGIGISVLLLTHSVNANNPLLQNLCSLGKKNNCNAILKSDTAKVTSWLSWSEVGFFYFAGSFLSLLLVPSSINLIIWLNVLSLPYTLWSIYYQYRHKNWCVLCCSVQVILWLEFVVALLSHTPFTFYLTPYTFYLTSLAFISPILLWYILKSILQKNAEYNLLKQQLKKFKYNREQFEYALTKQPRYVVPNDVVSVILGNAEASTTITMVSNPFCEPCSKAHETLDKWLKARNDIQLKIVFTSADHDDDQRTKVARHVTALSLTENAALVEKALNDWYAQREKKYETWAKHYQTDIGNEVNQITKKQKQWCDMAEITFTPTILINGYKLPEPYRLDDIQYLIN